MLTQFAQGGHRESPMLFKFLVVFHTLGATLWTGGHLILALAILPPALAQGNPEPIQAFEERFERWGLGALLLQVLTGLALAAIYFPGWASFFAFDSFLSVYIALKLGLLLGTLALALHARLWLIPRLSAETLPSLAYYITGVTTLAVLFVVFGAGIRLGGF